MAVALKQITSVVMSVNGLKELCASNTSLVLEQSAQHRAQAQEALQIYTAHEQNAMTKQHKINPTGKWSPMHILATKGKLRVI